MLTWNISVLFHQWENSDNDINSLRGTFKEERLTGADPGFRVKLGELFPIVKVVHREVLKILTNLHQNWYLGHNVF